MRLERLAPLGAPRPCLLIAPALLLAANLGLATLGHASDQGTPSDATRRRHQLARISSGSGTPTGTDTSTRAESPPFTPRAILDHPTFRAAIGHAVTAPPPAPPPPPPPPPPPIDLSPSLPHDSVWRSLSHCESGGNWQRDSGNGYYGGLQFSLPSWQSVGGTGLPNEHPADLQIKMAERLQARQGWAAWPACSNRLGLR